MKTNKEVLREYKKALYIIDMVKGFVNTGPMHDKKIAATIPEQQKLIKKFIQENQMVSFIKDTHRKNATEFKNFPEHCLIGSKEAELVDALMPYEKDAIIYEKNSTSAFVLPEMLSDLENLTNLTEIVGCGCCTDICVLNFLIPLKNYFNQINREVSIFAVKQGIETYDSPSHHREEYNEMAYKLISQAGIILVENMEELEDHEKVLMK